MPSKSSAARPRRTGTDYRFALSRAGRLTSGMLLALCVGLVSVLGGPTPATAANSPTLITIAGPGLADPITVNSDTRMELFSELLKQVGWMQGATGIPMKVDQATLGNKFTVTVAAVGRPMQVYYLYPEASGGPRAFRPAAQPQGKSTDAWFYAAVSLPDVLRAAGVPLQRTAQAALHSGAYYYDTKKGAETPRIDLSSAYTEMETAVVTSVGASVLILLLLFGAARRDRSRYRRGISG